MNENALQRVSRRASRIGVFAVTPTGEPGRRREHKGSGSTPQNNYCTFAQKAVLLFLRRRENLLKTRLHRYRARNPLMDQGRSEPIVFGRAGFVRGFRSNGAVARMDLERCR